MNFDWKNNLKFLDDKVIQNAADEFRIKYWKRIIPVDIELILENKLGLFILPVESLRQTCNTDAMLLSNMREIVYDPTSPPFRLRYTIAHEIGHFVLHKNVIVKFRPQSYEDWLRVIEEIPETIWGRAEY